MTRTHVLTCAMLLLLTCSQLPGAGAGADLVITGGKVVTLDAGDTLAEAMAVRGGKIIAVGSAAEIQKLIGDKTQVIDASGGTVVPGFIETHCHAVGVARAALRQEYAELTSIAAVQEWVRNQAAKQPPGSWVRVPRNEITRLKERRFPTVAELDAAAPNHPVVFHAVTHDVLNSAGLAKVGITAETKEIKGGELVRDPATGRPVMILDGSSFLSKFAEPAVKVETDRELAMLLTVLRGYNAVGITSIFERAIDKTGWLMYQTLKERGDLPVRMTATFRSQFKDGAAVEKFVKELGLKPNSGDEWVRTGPLKITVDGGIHWGTTRLSEPYGPKRAAFYSRPDPAWMGNQSFTVERMADIFAAGHKLGWQMSAHVTGDGGMEAVLEALEKSDAITPAAPHRFNLIHAYFPSPKLVALARKLNVGVDTQGYLYYRDADFIADVYGETWAARFIGLKAWLDGGVPVATNSDHMIGLDPDHAMNSFNPMLMAWSAVTRKSDTGKVHGPDQRLSRTDALRTISTHGAWLSFDEAARGTIEPGKLADITILAGDYLTCDADAIRTLKVARTIVGGRTVYQRP